MRYGSNLLEEVLRRTDIVQLVGKRVKLTRRGQQFWGCCPFHKEKSPSFKVENARRTYKCFGCGKGGDAFKWLMETEGLSFPEAVERLAGEAGVELPKWSVEDEAREEKKKSLYDVVEAACAFFEAQLREPAGRAARDYLSSRGLNGEAAKRFRMGYAPSGNNALIEHLKTKNVTVDDMIAAGLARPGEGERGPRDFFFNRVTFAITDARGRVVAFGARALEADAKPKYINTGETGLFSKGQLLYNFATARSAAIKAQTIVVAEGYMDVIALVRAGFDYAVAPLGTALTEDQLGLLWRTAPEPVLAFDGDEAGLRAAHRAARLALPMLRPGMSLRFAFLPKGEDPDSFIAHEGPGAMGVLLEAAEPLSKVLWRVETEGKDFSTPERRAGLERSLAEIVGLIGDAKIADYYRRDFDERVFEAFKRRAPASPAAPGRRNLPQGKVGSRFAPPPPGPNSALLKASLLVRSGPEGARHLREQEIARLLLKDPEIAVRHGEILAEIPFSDRSLDTLRHELLNLAASGFRLENPGLETHLVAKGMADLVARLGRGAAADETSSGDGDVEAQFLRAAQDLRQMVESGPEQRRAAQRYPLEATEESWQEYLRLRTSSND
ncbi:MAG: DNA primase [Alphaproteobacteria bacterium]|nr:DNA primase [Alphaproteobacteria bacterium]